MPKKINISVHADEIIEKYRPLLLRLANEEKQEQDEEKSKGRESVEEDYSGSSN